MKKITKLIVVCFSFVLLQAAYAEKDFAQNTPIGLWKTIDDVTGRPKAIVEIWETPEKTLYGRILKVFQQPGRIQNEVCNACEGERHNKRIVGMTIMENLKRSKGNANEWENGKILDPKNGKTYNCLIRLTEGGKKLNARGYIGMPLFGRTQTWVRVNGLQTA